MRAAWDRVLGDKASTFRSARRQRTSSSGFAQRLVRKPVGHRANAIEQRERINRIAIADVAERDRDVERGADLGGAAEADAIAVALILAGPLSRLGDVERDANRRAPSSVFELRIDGGETLEQRGE
jgi:hypothetical protein